MGSPRRRRPAPRAPLPRPRPRGQIGPVASGSASVPPLPARRPRPARRCAQSSSTRAAASLRGGTTQASPTSCAPSREAWSPSWPQTHRGTSCPSRSSTSRRPGATRPFDRVVEIGIVVVGKGGVVTGRFNWLIQPGRAHPRRSARGPRHHHDEDVRDSPRLRGRRRRGRARAFEACIPAAYNAPFDRAFLMNEFARARRRKHRGAPSDARAAQRGRVGRPSRVGARDSSRREVARARRHGRASGHPARERPPRQRRRRGSLAGDVRPCRRRARAQGTRGLRPGAAPSVTNAGRRAQTLAQTE